MSVVIPPIKQADALINKITCKMNEITFARIINGFFSSFQMIRTRLLYVVEFNTRNGR